MKTVLKVELLSVLIQLGTSLMSAFYRRVWIPLRSIAAKVTIRVFGSNPRLVTGLNLINQGIDAIFFSDRLPAPEYAPIPAEQSADFGINVAGFVKGEFGIGALSRAFIMSLKAAGIPYAVNSVKVSGHSFADDTVEDFSDDNPFSVNLVVLNPPEAEWFHSMKGPGYSSGKRNIGCWAWELSRFPDEWSNGFRFYDEIWAQSRFSLDAVSMASPVPVVRVPPCIQIDSEVNAQRSRFSISDDKYVFLFNFDFHSFFTRKNPVALVKAFKMGFGDSREVLLVLKYINHAYHPKEVETLREAIGNASNIKVIDGYLRSNELYFLVACSDCYVSLHRSEGFGLTLAEAMYLGKPVIATGYSGNMDFMDVNNSFLVRYKLVEVGQNDYLPFRRGYVWAEPDVNHAAELMRFVYKNREYAAEVGTRAASDIRTLFNPAVTGQKIRRRLEIVMRKE